MARSGDGERFGYSHHERLPVEVLVFEVDPDHLEEFLRVDHSVWTLGEAFAEGMNRIPFVSKEVRLDDWRRGEVTLVFVWESMESWRRVGDERVQRDLQDRFDPSSPTRSTSCGRSTRRRTTGSTAGAASSGHIRTAPEPELLRSCLPIPSGHSSAGGGQT